MSKHRVLVVDDEKNIRIALKRWFEIKGYNVDVADDGDSALEMCTEQAYDAVTLDLEMPRMNGRDAFVAIRKLYPHLPIIVLTGYFDHMSDFFSNGVTKVLYKPISLQIVEEEVRKAIHSAQSMAS